MEGVETYSYARSGCMRPCRGARAAKLAFDIGARVVVWNRLALPALDNCLDAFHGTAISGADTEFPPPAALGGCLTTF